MINSRYVTLFLGGASLIASGLIYFGLMSSFRLIPVFFLILFGLIAINAALVAEGHKHLGPEGTGDHI
ncbi:hypothetical protein [Bosea sp. PAMC 26642]|uniref:hypothetical protein n=1 Tax=Bosea sp. (strain PAMC 26642) TaxID=1792307 RepID=UPI00076FFE02|nr:hypothetical protein [Bosea sp. PAMC 26642]AMJ61073.1 hypothetical protein AXW83_12935 [Bosea sp. PAMC 26642]